MSLYLALYFLSKLILQVSFIELNAEFMKFLPSTMVTSRFLLLWESELTSFSLSSSFLKRLTAISSFFSLAAEGPVHITEGLEFESVLVGLMVDDEVEYSELPVLIVGDGLVVKVIKVGDVVIETLGDVGFEAMAAS